jgi:hypothetical protein
MSTSTDESTGISAGHCSHLLNGVALPGSCALLNFQSLLARESEQLSKLDSLLHGHLAQQVQVPVPLEHLLIRLAMGRIRPVDEGERMASPVAKSFTQVCISISVSKARAIGLPARVP